MYEYVSWYVGDWTISVYLREGWGGEGIVKIVLNKSIKEKEKEKGGGAMGMR